MMSQINKGMLLSLVMAVSFLPFEIKAQIEEEGFLEGQAINLEQAIQVALANSPRINAALLQVKDADQLVKISYSEVYPNIVSSASYTRNIEIPVQFIPARFFDPTAPEDALAPVQFGTDNNWQGGFTVTQNIFKGDALVGLSTSEIFKAVQEENLRSESQQVITQTRVSYYRVLASKEQVRLQEAQIRRLEQNLNENRARREAGLIDEYAVLQLEVQLSNQRPQLTEARYALNEAYRNLKVIMGIPVNFNLEISGNLNAFDIQSEEAAEPSNSILKKVDRLNPVTLQNPMSNMESWLDDRGDIRILQSRLNLNRKEIDAVRSRFLPVITATYNLQWTASEPGAPNFFQNPEPNTNPIRFQTLGINVSLPIFEGFKRSADLQRAKISRKTIEVQKRQAELSAQNEVVGAVETLNKVFETAEARKLALQQANEGYDRALNRFENGLGSQIEVTDAEVQVRQAEVNYTLMVLEYLTAKAQYDLAVGKVPYVDIDPQP